MDRLQNGADGMLQYGVGNGRGRNTARHAEAVVRTLYMSIRAPVPLAPTDGAAGEPNATGGAAAAEGDPNATGGAAAAEGTPGIGHAAAFTELWKALEKVGDTVNDTTHAQRLALVGNFQDTYGKVRHLPAMSRQPSGSHSVLVASAEGRPKLACVSSTCPQEEDKTPGPKMLDRQLMQDLAFHDTRAFHAALRAFTVVSAVAQVCSSGWCVSARVGRHRRHGTR